MIVCVLLTRLSLTAALGGDRRTIMGQPVALAPEPERETRIGECSPAAEAFGVRSGMRVGEALARCPELRLVSPDPEAARAHWRRMLAGLEGVGASIESDEPGLAWFEANGLRRLHGGRVADVLAAARKALPVTARVGAAETRFGAYAAAVHGSRRSDLIVPGTKLRAFLAPLPVSLLGVRRGLEGMPELLGRLGVDTLGELSALPAWRVFERFGHPGRLAHELASGADTPLEPRWPTEPLLERLALPDSASGAQLERALELIIARLLARPERRGRSLRSVAIGARFVESGTWRSTVAFRSPTADCHRIRLALAPRLAALPAPAESLTLEVEAFGPPSHDQLGWIDDPAAVRRSRLDEAVRHVRQAAGEGSLLRIIEIDPDSRIPERRAVLSPYMNIAR